MLNMVFDFNAWNLKWRDCKTGTAMKKYYWEKLEEAREEFKDDWRMFLESYNDPTHILRINEEFLDEKIEEILENKLYLGYEFQFYLQNKYPQYDGKIMQNRKNQREIRSSVLACGLKPLMANAVYEEDEKQLLFFEVWEFTLTYPEYKDLFIEEIVE